jgi:pyruvate/2-oxoglutarate dehydrogenase complex dihydrolipoamide dehydrogenase (E3) component
MMVRAAGALAEARRVPGLAGAATVTPDWAPVARRIRDEATDDWDDAVAVKRFKDKGGRFVRGRGRIVGPRTVEVDGRCFEAGRALVVATGTEPVVPPVEGLAGTPYWTNREAVEATAVPGSLVVLGGGAIGVELAQVFARFGAGVTVVEAVDRLVAAEEPEAGTVLAARFAAEGIAVRTGVGATRVDHDGHRFTLTLADGSEVAGERLLVAVGRRSDLDGLGAAALDIDLPGGARALPVDDRLRVADGVWAVGDVTGHGAFTHVSMYQARIAAADILGRPHAPADYRALPRVTFTDPEIGSVGRTEAQARQAGIDVSTATIDGSGSARGWIHGPGADGLIKLVADRDRGVLVGATSMGPAGGEVLGLLTLAVHAEVPLDRLRTMIYAYPTFHRGVEDALRDLAGG